MHISYIIYIILNSRCYTGVRAPKLSHRSSYIKEPFGKGLDGLPGGWTGASEGLEGGLRGLRPVQGGFKGAWEGLQGGFKGAWEGLEGGLLEGGFKGAWEGLQGASRGLEKGLKGASRWRGLQGVEKGFKGASRGRGLQGSLVGASEGLQRASRGLQKGLKGVWARFERCLRKAWSGLRSFWEGCAAWSLAPQTDHLRLQYSLAPPSLLTCAPLPAFHNVMI